MTDPSERQGETDPSYRFIKDQTKLLGRGSFKEVYKAFDNERGIEVAWNQIASSKLSVKERQQLASEIDTLKTIHHRNIIKFYDYWVDKKKKQIVFISEFVSSGTIKAYIERTGVPRQPVLRNWCRQILSALAYLHGLNPKIIHRDLKCDNIFINGYNGLVKVGDLGLATKQIESKSKSLIGTPEFMAPELYEENYNEKVDIYAFGMCILEMITNQYPYNECRTAAQIFRAVTSGTPPKALSKVTDDNTRCFIELCIQKDPNRRPTAQELLESSFLKDMKDSEQQFQSSNQEKNEGQKIETDNQQIDFNQEHSQGYTFEQYSSPFLQRGNYEPIAVTPSFQRFSTGQPLNYQISLNLQGINVINSPKHLNSPINDNKQIIKYFSDEQSNSENEGNIMKINPSSFDSNDEKSLFQHLDQQLQNQQNTLYYSVDIQNNQIEENNRQLSIGSGIEQDSLNSNTQIVQIQVKDLPQQIRAIISDENIDTTSFAKELLKSLIAEQGSQYFDENENQNKYEDDIQSGSDQNDQEEEEEAEEEEINLTEENDEECQSTDEDQEKSEIDEFANSSEISTKYITDNKQRILSFNNSEIENTQEQQKDKNQDVQINNSENKQHYQANLMNNQ